MSAAADAAALACAFEVKNNSSITQSALLVYAKNDAKLNGFDANAVPGISVTVNHPPKSGPYTGQSQSVEVILSQPVSTFFMPVLGPSSMTVSARAVAGPGSAGCVYALNTNDPKYTTELDVGGSSGTVINVPDCAIVSNGNFTVSSGNSVTASSIAVTAPSGTISGSVTPAPNYNVPPSSDPFSNLNEAALFGTSWTCGWSGKKIKSGVTTNISSNGPFTNGVGTGDTSASYVLNPGVYCGNGSTPGITITLSSSPPNSVTFNPGVYIVNGGGLNWKHSLVNGTGITLYLTGSTNHAYPSCGGKVFSSDAPLTMNLSAPTTGNYAGLLMVQDRTQATGCSSNPVIAQIVPASMTIDGVIYFPNHHIVYGATTTSSGNYTVLVGGTILFQNQATLNSNFQGGGLSGNPATRPGLGE
jgi:hypothetical protein